MDVRYVFDIDDLCDDFDPWEELHELRKRYPNLRVTAFAIPGRCSDELLARYRGLDWVELGAHGYWHSSMECATWPYSETREKLAELSEAGWLPVFRAPGWAINEEVYSALADEGWICATHSDWLEGSEGLPLVKYVYQQYLWSIHGHTWETSGNGPSRWGAMFEGVPADAAFAFVSEVAQ